MTKTFLAYIRKSVIEGETASPARQRAAIERRVRAAYPDAMIRWYEDLDLSGRYEANRPGWQRLLSDLETEGGDGVAVESYDRSHRNVREFLDFYDNSLAPAGRTLISATQNIDMATADGRAMATVILAFAELEARKSSERMQNTLQHIRKEGRHHGGIPFGCDRDPLTKHLIPSQTAYLYNPATGEARPDEEPPPPGFERRYYHDALRILYETYAAGNISLTETAIQLNAAGWRAWLRDRKTPMEFGGNTTRSIVRNWPAYAARLPLEVGQDAGARNRPPLFEASYTPILPVELCEAAAAALRSRVGQGGPKAGSLVYLLGGLAYCGGCGGKLSGQSQPNGNRYYRHTNIKRACDEKMGRAAEIEAEIIELVGELAGGLLAEVREELRRLEAEIIAGEAGSAGEIERKRAEMERLISLRMKDLITEDEFSRHRAALQAEIERLQPAQTGGIREVEETLEALETLLAGFGAGDPALQKEVIRGLFERVEIQGQQISRVVYREWVAGLLAVIPGLDRGPGRCLHTVMA